MGTFLYFSEFIFNSVTEFLQLVNFFRWSDIVEMLTSIIWDSSHFDVCFDRLVFSVIDCEFRIKSFNSLIFKTRIPTAELEKPVP